MVILPEGIRSGAALDQTALIDMVFETVCVLDLDENAARVASCVMIVFHVCALNDKCVRYMNVFYVLR